MSKTMRESKMLELVRRWRAEAYRSLRHEPLAARRRRTVEEARRLNLPILDDDQEVETDARPSTGKAQGRA